MICYNVLLMYYRCTTCVLLISASQEASAIALAPVRARHSIFAGAKITLVDAWYKCYLWVMIALNSVQSTLQLRGIASYSNPAN